MIHAQIQSKTGKLSEESVRSTLQTGLGTNLDGARVLVLIPDHTRSVPLPFLFRSLVELAGKARQLDFMVALGTHPPLEQTALNQLVGISQEERRTKFKSIGLSNHAWQDPAALVSLGKFEPDQIRELAGEFWHPSLPVVVPIRINKAVFEYDRIVIIAPTFPHEVVGFSGGAKYLFPGISGPEMINATHWLGALAGVVRTIGVKETPVRAMIHAAAAQLPTPVTLIGLVVEEHELSAVFVGDLLSAWSAAADFSAERHIRQVDKPFRRILSRAPEMYDELWTASKAMYKLEPAAEIGGEVVIFAPHLKEVSRAHGKYIFEIGYHILPYFLENWEHFKHIPLGVLAHSTHLRGSGHMENGLEKPNVRVTLASQLSPEDCARLNLGYLDPATVDLTEWQGRETEGFLYVRSAGETLYRLRTGR
jgi:lactate racemase